MKFYLYNESSEILCSYEHFTKHTKEYRFLTEERIKGINTYRNHEARPKIFYGSGHFYLFMKFNKIKGYDMCNYSLRAVTA